jgi:hypothetical protein
MCVAERRGIKFDQILIQLWRRSDYILILAQGNESLGEPLLNDVRAFFREQGIIHGVGERLVENYWTALRDGRIERALRRWKQALRAREAAR